MTDRTLTATRRSDPSGVVVLTVNGELDHHTAPQVTQVLQQTPFTPEAPVVMDLTNLSYCDSTGITVLVGAYNRARETATPLILAAVADDLMRVLQIVGLDQIFTFRPTVDEAIATLSAPSAE
ncbi:STAS domain-containing protein [Streptomyces sp. NPDC046939]|uniref:STAS domain-containing protein n=1 Tax=Streptomyces sp. NPDC046939 TaxID=3155376 RepID=UPI003400766E